MKYIYTFVILLVCNYTFAQDSRLFENEWRLTNLIKNSIDNFPPVNSELLNITLAFDSETSMLTDACNEGFGQCEFTGITDFTVIGYMVTLSFCSIPENNPYDSLYHTFFMSDATADFIYAISESENLRTLTITSMTGDQAIYSNQMLSTIEPKMADLNIYPNPALDYINVNLGEANLDNTEIEIFDSLGKLCKAQNITVDQEKIGVENLAGGIYLIKIKTDKATITKKFLKL